jgi:peptidoglycan/LPS O-acetylase OafA/YrhL
LDKLLNRSDHYAALDGLRGFAAISVVLVHIGHWLNHPVIATNSGLAVDLFFCLSGFVLPLAYEKRFQVDLSILKFVKVRLIRLMPLIVLGTLISASYILTRSYVSPVSPRGSISYQELALATLLGVINIPLTTASAAIGGPQIFPLNGPQFSLFLEVVVNILWAGIRSLIRLWVYVFICIVCLVTLSLVGLRCDDAETYWIGFPRVGASFFAGVLIFHIDKRFSSHIAPKYLFWPTSIVMVLLFYYPEEVPRSIQLIWVGLLSPLLIYSGSKTHLSGKVRSLALIGGELSYPIYALHYPIFCWINGAYVTATKQQNIIIEGPLVIAGVLAGSYFALKLFDIPFRNWAGRLTRAPSGRLAPR